MPQRLLFILIFSLLAHDVFAAFPVKEQQKRQINSQSIAQEKILSAYQKSAMPGYGGNPHTEDIGVFGILSIIFALTGLFPFAIICGAIGTQNGRMLRGLARAGLLLGILCGVIFICFIFYLQVLA